MANILLIGGNFKNKGAEAMVLTAVKQLTARLPGVSITAASYAKKENRPYGKQRIAGMEFDFICNSRSLLRPLRVALFKITGSKAVLGDDHYLRCFSESDLIIDVSGFALTDQRPLLRRIVYCFEIATAKLLSKPFVCFTQAMGPFDNFVTRVLAKLFLPQTSLIIARGESTLRYLKQLGIDRSVEVIRCSDSAYLFEVGKDVDTTDILESGVSAEQKLFGIVPNINIFSRTYPQDENNPYINLLVELSTYAQNVLGAKVVFVCHEHYANKKDDEWIVEQVRKRVKGGEQLLFISATEPAERLKAVIGKLDFVVASRFHSVVGAISKRVPFLSLGWSHKYRELVEETGLSQCVLDGRDLSPSELVARVELLWKEQDQVRIQLEKMVPALEQSSAEAFDRVAALYRSSI